MMMIQEWQISLAAWEAVAVSQAGHPVNEDGFIARVSDDGHARLGVLDETSSKSGVSPGEAVWLVQLAIQDAKSIALAPKQALERTDEILRKVLTRKGAMAGVCAVLADIRPELRNCLNVSVAGLGDCSAAVYSPRRWWRGWRSRFAPVITPHTDDLGHLVACLGQNDTAPHGKELKLWPGDILVLASDGALNPHQRERDWEWAKKILGEPADLYLLGHKLILAAREQGSRDDATILLVRPHPHHTDFSLVQPD